jgi:hypothetical protein
MILTILNGETLMGFEVGIFSDAGLDADFVEWLVDERSVQVQQYFGRMWEY